MSRPYILGIIDSRDGPMGSLDHGPERGSDGWGALDHENSVAIHDQHGLLVARVLRDNPPDREGRTFPPSLFATAPDLLEALRRLVHPMADDDDLEHARAIIAKATGAEA